MQWLIGLKQKCYFSMTNEFIFRSIRYYKERKMPKHAEFLDGRDYIYNCAWKSPKQHQSAPKTEKEEESQNHSLLCSLPALAHCCSRRGRYWRRCFMQLVHFDVFFQEHFLASLSLTMTNRSFVPLSTYSSLTRLLGFSYRKELSSIGTFSFNHTTLQSSKSNPFSSWNNLLKLPLRHTACLYSLPLMLWKKQKCAELSPVAVPSFNVIHGALKTAMHFVDQKS